MNNYSRIWIATIVTLVILISCRVSPYENVIEYSEAEFTVNTSNIDGIGMRSDTIPDPDPNEPEYPGEEPEEEIPLPEEMPDPIPDTIGIWNIN